MKRLKHTKRCIYNFDEHFENKKYNYNFDENVENKM